MDLGTLLSKERLTIDDGRFLLGEATRRMEPSEELANWWDGYSAVAAAFANNENVCAASMYEMRNSLEFITPQHGEEFEGGLLIAGSKLVLSAVVLFTQTKAGSVAYVRDKIFDDVDPLIDKAAMLLHPVKSESVGVGFDDELPGALEKLYERNRLQYLIETAVKPSA